MTRRHLALAAVLALASGARAACVAPPGGFAVRELLGRELVFADGYRTRADLRFPDPALVPAPAGGWPGILFVHALRSDRHGVAARAREFAALGYFTITYDVRGQGDTRALNTVGGSTFVGPVEKSDMAEVLWSVQGEFDELLDFDRLGVAGFSQGGLHARAAAAWSGHRLPRPRGNVTHFPTLRAVHADAALGTTGELMGRDGAVFVPLGLGPFVAPAGLVAEPENAQDVLRLFVAQDFDGWAAWQRSPGRDDAAWLAASAVPLLCQTSWDDRWTHPNSVVDALATMPATTPWFVHIETGDHDAPANLVARAARDERERRWFDHFLKGVNDEMPSQPRFHLAVTPDDPNTYTDQLAIWPHRRSDSWPQSGATVTEELWLRAGAALAGSPPTGGETAETVVHAVAAGFDPSGWLRTGNDTALVFAQVPLSQALYRGAPLAADRELHGRVRVTVHLRSSAPHLQVGVVLFDEAPTGELRYVTGGYDAARDRRASRSVQTVELGGCCYVFRRGHRIVVGVENQVWHRPPGQSELRTVPYFDSYRFDVEHSASRASKVELPFLPEPAFGCRAAIVRLSRSRGGTVLVALDGAPLRAGDAYATLVSVAGTVPGTSVLGHHLPLNFDALTDLGLLAAGSPTLPGFAGTLDANGRAFAGLVAPPGLIPSAWVGAQLSFTAVALGPGRFSVAPASQTRLTD